MSSSFNKKELDETVEQVFRPLNDKEHEELKQIQEEFSKFQNQKISSIHDVREKALIAYYDKLSNQNRKGSNREVKRRVFRWLDKVGAEFITNENNFNFSVVSKRYSAVLEVTFFISEKGEEYKMEWLK